MTEQAGAFMIIDPAAHVGEHIGFGVEVRACETCD